MTSPVRSGRRSEDPWERSENSTVCSADTSLPRIGLPGALPGSRFRTRTCRQRGPTWRVTDTSLYGNHHRGTLMPLGMMLLQIAADRCGAKPGHVRLPITGHADMRQGAILLLARQATIESRCSGQGVHPASWTRTAALPLVEGRPRITRDSRPLASQSSPERSNPARVCRTRLNAVTTRMLARTPRPRAAG